MNDNATPATTLATTLATTPATTSPSTSRTTTTPPAVPISPTAASRPQALAALAALLVLFICMNTAMLTGVVPHPPAVRGPYLAAAMALCAAAAVQFAMNAASARWFGFAAALLVLPGVGPHKFVTEPNPDQLAPVLDIGSASALMLAWASWRAR